MYPHSRVALCWWLFFFFFNDTATTEIYTLSLHDALPIYRKGQMLWIAPPKWAWKPAESHGSLDHKIRGSAEAFKLLSRSRTISVGTRRVRACTQLLTTGGPYGTMQGTAQVAGANKV